MALAPLLLVEAHLDQGHRLSGLGGEVARGFYYAGQPADAQTSSRLVERLAEWRIFANEAVEPAALDPTFLAEARERTLATLAAVFEPGDWLRATDAFYLYQRMHRWGAAHGSVAAVRRPAVNPMFDRRFIELALAVAPGDKKDSMLLGRLMTELDPELAGIPLDSGLIPSRLGTRDLSTRVAIATVTVRRGTSKVRQKLTHGRRPQLGAADAAALVLAHWRAVSVIVSGVVRPADAQSVMGRRLSERKARRSAHNRRLPGEPPGRRLRRRGRDDPVTRHSDLGPFTACKGHPVSGARSDACCRIAHGAWLVRETNAGRRSWLLMGALGALALVVASQGALAQGTARHLPPVLG